MSQQPVYVDSEVVKTLIEDKSKIPGKDYLVIDVRDDDYVVTFAHRSFARPPIPKNVAKTQACIQLTLNNVTNSGRTYPRIHQLPLQ